MKSVKNPNKPGAVVLGGHVQGYGVVQILGENQIPSIVVDKTRFNIARHSKYCIGFFKTGYDGLIDCLIGLGKEGLFKDWLLMPTDDYHVRLLSQKKNELSRYFKVTVDDWETINLFFNKKNSYPLARSAGVPVPRTFYPDSKDDLQIAEAGIDYPCIVKPAIMLDFTRYFKKKVFVCQNQHELKEKFAKATERINPRDLMIQEIIPGSSENQYSVGIFFDRDKYYNCLVARRKRQHPVDFGNATTYAETIDIPILVEYARKILTGANFFGLCEVEFKFDPRDRQYKFLEVNPRTWKWHLISKPAGIPFLPSLYHYFTEDRPIVAKHFKQAGWSDVGTDLPVIFDMKGKGVYKKADKRTTISAVANLKDFMPFVFQLFYVPYNLFKR
jgi:D-aspartate ligase